MKSAQIFIGNIIKCTKYEMHPTFSNSIYIDEQCIASDSFGYIEEKDELYKENAILIEIKNRGYVDLETLNSILDYIKIYKDITRDGYRLGGLIMSTLPHCTNSLFVDETSLKPYFNCNQQIDDISVRQLKKKLKKNK